MYARNFLPIWRLHFPNQLRAGTDGVMRDAVLLEDSVAGVGTKNHLLVNRVVRYIVPLGQKSHASSKSCVQAAIRS